MKEVLNCLKLDILYVQSYAKIDLRILRMNEWTNEW